MCAYLKNRDQIINVGMIGHASTEDTRVLRCSGGTLPDTVLEFMILKLLEMYRNCQPYRHHVILYHFKPFMIISGGYCWHREGGGGRVHTANSPCLSTGLARNMSVKHYPTDKNKHAINKKNLHKTRVMTYLVFHVHCERSFAYVFGQKCYTLHTFVVKLGFETPSRS